MNLSKLKPIGDDSQNKDSFNSTLNASLKLITAGQCAEDSIQKLEELNNYIKVLMDSLASYALLLDHEAKILYTSDSFLSLTENMQENTLIGMPVIDAYQLIFQDKEFSERASRRLARMISGENDFSEEDAFDWPSVGKRLFRITYKRILNEDNNLSGIVITSHDITESRLEEAKIRLDDILKTTVLPCVVWDENGETVAYNKEAVRVFCDQDNSAVDDFAVDAFNDSFYSLHPEFQLSGKRTETLRQERIMDALERGFAQDVVQLVKNDGTSLYFRVNIARFTWLFNYMLIVYYHDITDAKVAEKNMKESLEKARKSEIQIKAAQAANETKNQFLANMSHEIRTPMNAILGMSELLLQENLNDTQFRYVKDIKTATMALLDIINDILDVSKFQAGKLTLIPVHFDFNTFIDNIHSMARVLVEGKNTSFRLVMQEQAHICLFSDDVRLRQVLLNLISNAIKYTEIGYIQLTVSFTNNTIKMTVSDTGIGIKAKCIPTLFDAFVQSDVLKNRTINGTGLGLTITKAIVDMMGGNITVESEYGKGTSFHVEIPIVLGDVRLIQQNETKECAVYAPGAQILVIDDSLTNLNVASGLLKIFKIEADTATSGMQAIEMIKHKQYDLVFMDHRMPVMDGIETTMELRKMGIDIPIVALTASAVVGAKEKMLAAGMNDYLWKPLVKSDLINILLKWLPVEKMLVPLAKTDTPDEPDDEERTDFWNRIEQIAGLSVADGLERVEGQRDVYEKSLKLLMYENEKTWEKLDESLSAEDMDGFRIAVHGIKGALVNVGAMELSAAAFDLEMAAAQKDYNYCFSNLTHFVNRLKNFNMELKEAFCLINQNVGTIEIPPEMPFIFARMADAFAEVDIVALDGEMEKLDSLNLNGALKEAIEQIKDAVLMMDYDWATEQIHELICDA